MVVVFGSAGVRARAWRNEARALELAAKFLGSEEILDVGLGSAGAPRELGGVPVRGLGELPAARVSELLSNARAGFLAYPPNYLDKSTVFGAYLAHGVLPVVAWSGPRGRAPRAEEVWVRASNRGLDLKEEPDAVACRARAKYEARSLRRHAEIWEKLLREKCAS